ncbi:unnamed protein product [Medioppia subpectinata]|uniref:Peptidase S1 domain-containing protein n=1 Tax=Medioppia subpectinata TaxID=1979941 RepID=A0A7R9Q6A7_9ACAR|nr:unnamed protein product [Medioppia subpectinata]CAG2113674.1 unnamed protein product [Medioppia subpectinata]
MHSVLAIPAVNGCRCDARLGFGQICGHRLSTDSVDGCKANSLYACDQNTPNGWANESGAHNQHALNLPHCGLTTVNSAPTGGDDHPWVATFYRRSMGANQGVEQFCAGVIITDRLILSAAHCFQRRKLLDFRMMIGSQEVTLSTKGTIVLKPESVSFPGLISKRWIKLHDQYSNSTHVNDIALIRTSQAISFQIKNGSFTVNSACLPAAHHEPKGHVISAGRSYQPSGVTTTTTTRAPRARRRFRSLEEEGVVKLKMMTSSVINANDCKRVANETRYKDLDGGYEIHNILISETRFCVMSSVAPGLAIGGAGYNGPAYGDSGTAYIQYVKNRAHVVGLVSYFDPEMKNPTTQVTKVSKFLDWISESAQLNLDAVVF